MVSIQAKKGITAQICSVYPII